MDSTPAFDIDVIAIRLAPFCEAWNIASVSVFGSVLRKDFNADSDIDLLVEFDSGFIYTLTQLDEMETQLRDIFGRDVDLIDKQALLDSPNYIRRQVILDSAQVIYADESNHLPTTKN